MNKDIKIYFEKTSKPPSKQSSEIVSPSHLDIMMYENNQCRLSVKTNQKPRKIYYLVRLLGIISEYFCKLYKKRRIARVKSLGKQAISVSEINRSNMEHKNISDKFVRLITKLILVQRAIRLFRWRTKYRKMQNFTNTDLNILDDLSHLKYDTIFHKKLSYIKNKTIRASIRYIKRFSRKQLKGCLIFFKKSCRFLYNLEKYVPVIIPDHKIKMIWDMIIIFIITLFFCIIPVQICFDIFYEDEIEEVLHKYQLSSTLSGFLVFLPELMLIIDTFLKFITGFYEDGVVIVEKSEIATHYLKKGLIFDLFSYFPIIVQGVMRKNYPYIFDMYGIFIKILQLLMFFKIKRVRTAISNFEEIIVSNGRHDFILNGFRLIYVILFVTHLNACIWHAVAYFNTYEHILTWLDYSNLKESYWTTRYLYSFYWALSMIGSIGFGEKISPQNNMETILGGFILLNSIFLFGYFINTMKQILDMMTKQEFEYKETIRIINGYMNKNNLDFELQSRVRKYLEYTMTNQSNLEAESIILNKLTKTLKNEVLLDSYGKFIQKIDFFKNNFSNSSLQDIMLSLKELRLTPEEFLYYQNDIDDNSLYIVAEGNLEEVRINPKNGQIETLRKLMAGTVFGWYSFMTEGKRISSIISKNFSTIFEIKRYDFIQIIQKNPLDYQNFCMIKDKIKLYHEFCDFDIRCPLCRKFNHFSGECEKFHFYPDQDFIIKRNNYSIDQIRRKDNFVRKKKKFNALSDNFMIQCSSLKYNGCLEEEDESSEDEHSLVIEEEIKEKKHFRERKSHNFGCSSPLSIRELKKNFNKNISIDNSSELFERTVSKKRDSCNDNLIFEDVRNENMNFSMFSPEREKRNFENFEDNLSKNGLRLAMPKKYEVESEEKNVSFKNTVETKNDLKKLHSQMSLSKSVAKYDLYDFKFEEIMNFLYYFPENNFEEIFNKIIRNDKTQKSMKKRKKNLSIKK